MNWFIKMAPTLMTWISLPSLAQVDATYRQNNAVAIYDFSETSGDILDKSTLINPATGVAYAPLNLEVYHSSAVRNAGDLGLGQANLVRSKTAADKITNLCRTTGELSIEMEITNLDSVITRSGRDANGNQGRIQPLRILSLSKSLKERNFVFGQFYTDGNHYSAGVSTSINEPNDASIGNSLREPLNSTVASTLVPDATIGRSALRQKIIFTIANAGNARLYLSDKTGSLYLAQTSSVGFGADAAANYFKSWDTGAYLAIGNENMTKTEFLSWLGVTDNFTGCNTSRDVSEKCFTNPNRWWKGRIHNLAIYCKEIPKDLVLGNGLPSLMKALQIDLNQIPSDSDADAKFRKRAMLIYNRLAGVKVPTTSDIINQMIPFVKSGAVVEAAELVTHEPTFYNVTVRDFAARISNREKTINVPLNDFIATIVGVVRDNLSAQTLLTEDMVYVGNTQNPVNLPVPNDLTDDHIMSNNHYEAIDKGKYDLAKALIRTNQKIYSSKDKAVRSLGDDAAGLFTTRQWQAAHSIAGTQRRPVQMAFEDFLCSPLEKIADASGPDDVVGADIDRFPGGSHGKYTSTCRGCHTIMDGFRPAFSKWTFSKNFAKHADFTARFVKANANDDENNSLGMEMNPIGFTVKVNKNTDVYKDACRVSDTGTQTPDSIGCLIKSEKWVNNANRGANALRFKFTRTEGKSLRDFGRMIVESPKFASCMAERVFKSVCNRAPQLLDMKLIESAANEFSKSQGYSLKYLFQRIGSSDECLGGFDE